MGQRVIGLELDEPLGRGDGLPELALLGQRHRKPVPRDRERGFDFDRASIERDGFGHVALREGLEALLVGGLGIGMGRALGRFVDVGHGDSLLAARVYVPEMEIRTLATQERMAVAERLDEWHLAEGWTAGDRFRQHVEHDPNWRDDNVAVATEHGRVVALLSILPRHLRILGHVIPVGGVSNLFVEPAARGRGVATALLAYACDLMRTRGMELAVAFPGAPPATVEFFAKRGWHAWGGQQTILRVDPEGAARGAKADGDIVLERISHDDVRALQAVKSIHTAYGASRSGTVVRDEALWAASFRLVPAPREECWIARRGGLSVAYARLAIVADVLTLTEIGRFEDGADALAQLIASFFGPRAEDPLAPPTAGISSEQLRSFLVLPTFDDIGLTVALEHRGIRSHPMDESQASFCCVNLIGLAARLDVDLLPGEEGAAFLQRILPPDAMVFWPADRF